MKLFVCEVKSPASSSLLATLWETLNAKFNFPLEPVQEDELSKVLAQDLARLNSDFQTSFQESVQWQVAQQLNAQQAVTEETIEDDEDLSQQLVAIQWCECVERSN